MFRPKWGGVQAKVHADVCVERHKDDPSASTSYTLVEDDNNVATPALQRGDSVIPESKSFRIVPLMQDTNRVVPLMPMLLPVNESQQHRRHSDFSTKPSEPGAAPPSAVAPPSPDNTLLVPLKVKTSRREQLRVFAPPETTQSSASRSTPLWPSQLEAPSSSLVIAYKPLNRCI
ncbi:hypothetical protein H310_09461 [Aphanomyces invadans]|uniref:Uncharacterized protein n=1 Tax=Aphanomyces invadans TaxID=157072 RepID=A0A024TW23_9STRA|nr:hypothetical protein H310_09461 [Aphanomyces invadans]ETV97547.1 hypothetical protein H310_09461 [Aphanomyces invadans]|eukprot:XP_008873756.1 hypothetical protein H310_09461 [Aphanomyces invadans]